MLAARKPVLQKTQRYTYADYCTWDDNERWELIDGVAYAMSPPAPTESHQSISGNIYLHIGQFLRGKGCKVFYAPFDVRLNAGKKDNTVVQPDILVVCDKSKLDGKSCVGAPDMVVEILSPSTAVHDMIRKYGLYQKSGVREYWIVDPETKTVVTYIWENGKEDKKIYDTPEIVPVYVLEGCNVDLAEVFEE